MHEHHEMQGVEKKLSQSHKIGHHLLFLLCKTLQSTQVGYLAWGQPRWDVWVVWDGLNPGGMGGVSSCRSQCARRKTGGVRVSQQPIRWQRGNEHLLGGHGWPCVRQCMGLSRSSGCQTVSGDLCLIVSTSPPSDDGLWPWTGVQLQHIPISTIPT